MLGVRGCREGLVGALVADEFPERQVELDLMDERRR
jgi:hypothetical protein